jgi:ATP-dependent exoDNAse (exonuclease V) beta subunit
LDCRFDHIVLDEFQDTSRRQWNLLKVLADEILQDSEERRSFFYVGDTKQSIYGWRNGDDRLFREIFDHYNQHQPDWIKDEKLKVSYRSDRKIIQVVNALFCPDTCREGSEEFELSEKLVQRWQASWVDHSARENAGEGYVALIEYPEPEKPPTSKSKTGSVDAAAIDATTNPVAVERDEDEEAEDSPTLAGDVLGILQEVQPWLRGLTCGVLTRNNQEAEDLAKHLRENHIPTRLEGRAATIATNPESYALYNLIRSVAYHHDPMAAAFLTISPWRILVPDALSDREKVAKFRRAAQQSVAAEGFLKTIRKWVEVAASAGVVNSTKLEAMLDAVEEFATTKKPLDSWGSLVGFLESHQTEDALTTGVVQVMTIHKAKGLGMDVVVLPQLHIPWAKPLRAQDLATVRSEQGLIESALKLPSAPYCDEDEFLAGLRGQFIDDRIFEEFCCFYVAVTRAKQALYFITRPHRKGDSTKSIAQWVQKFFPASQPSARAGQATDLRAEGGGRDRPKMEIRELGNPRWFENKPLREQQAPAIFQQADKSSSAFPKPQGEIKPQPPSGNRARTVSGSQLFPAAAATQLGSEVHELLAQVLWREQEPDYRSVSPRAAKIVRSFLQTSSASFLDQPVQPVMVWREKAFDVMLNGVPVSGIFDRVHVYKNADGTVASAEIFDYKTTSSGEDLPENYVSQIETYRRAAAALLALSESSIQAHIIPITTAAR